jgi:hypothetical protein
VYPIIKMGNPILNKENKYNLLNLGSTLNGLDICVRDKVKIELKR